MDKTLEDQAKEIKKMAAQSGVQSNYLFITTFDRYEVQLGILSDIKKALDQNGMTVTKEYVKNRKNLYANPMVAEYNRAVDSANKTVSTLMRILNNFGANEKGGDKRRDDLVAAINGGDDYEEAD